MTTGISAVWHDSDQSFELRELPVQEVEPGGVSIRVLRTSVCGSDLHIWRGDGIDKDAPPREPFVFGHEMMGEVAALGKGVDTDSLRRPLKEGDRVVFSYFFPCMKCYNCIRGEMGACKFRMGRKPLDEYPYCNGGFAQYYYLRPQQNFLFKLPDDVSDEEAAPINCALAQVIDALHVGRVRFGDNVVVQGAGGLGVNAMAVARDMGANQVIAIDGQPARLDLAMRSGATDTININDFPTPESRIERVMELTSGIGADIAIELVGFPSAVEEGVQMVRQRGTYLEVGHITPHSYASIDVQQIVSKQIRLFGIQHYDPWILPAAIEFMRRNRDRYAVCDVVSDVFPMTQIGEAFSKAEWQGQDSNKITRAVVAP
jgi:threonine dehydrogenase-like Zn-dependent dehydrogenase